MGFFNFFSKEKKETLDHGLEKTKEIRAQINMNNVQRIEAEHPQ